MLPRAQIASDFRSFDFLQPVYFYSRQDEDGNFASPIAIDALQTRGETEFETDLGNVGAGRRTAVFHFLVEDVETQSGGLVTVKPRDRLIDESGQKWELWTVQTQSANVRYRVWCTELTATNWP